MWRLLRATDTDVPRFCSTLTASIVESHCFDGLQRRWRRIEQGELSGAPVHLPAPDSMASSNSRERGPLTSSVAQYSHGFGACNRVMGENFGSESSKKTATKHAHGLLFSAVSRRW